MSRLFRFWQVVGHLFFCSYEIIAGFLTPVGAFLLSLIFFPYRELLSYPPPERLRVALERLGGAYVKIGQLLSTRVDLLPAEYVKELEKLQDRVPPQPLGELLSHYPELKEAFQYIDEKPIGSGSVAQVHRAILKDGREVALKVIRPKAEELIKRDVSTLKSLVSLFSFIPAVKEFRVPQIVSEFERMLVNELDLTAEAAYMELFRKFSKKEPFLYVPAVIWEFSSSRYLTTEFVRGKKLSPELFYEFPDVKREELAKRFVQIVNRTVFELGVFHGDLHPGNIFLLKNDKFAFVDFGIVGRLSPDTLTEFFLFSLGVMEKDPDVIVSSLKRIGAVGNWVNENLLKREVLIFLDKYYNRPLSQIDAERLFYEELSVARRFKIVLPEELVTLMKTIAHTESIARIIYPDFRLPPILKPYLKRIAPKMVASAVKRKGVRLAMDYGELLSQLPTAVKSNLKKEKRTESLVPFWSASVLGFSILLALSPKLLLVYIPSLYIFKKLAAK